MLFNGDSQASKVRIANGLALAGFLPFAACTLWLVLGNSTHPSWHQAFEVMRAYGISILSFLGGVRWGAALESDKAGRVFLHSVCPALVAWATIFMTPVFAIATLAMAFAAQGAWDVIAAQNGSLPRWFGPIRTKLTFLVVASLLVALFTVG